MGQPISRVCEAVFVGFQAQHAAFTRDALCAVRGSSSYRPVPTHDACDMIDIMFFFVTSDMKDQQIETDWVLSCSASLILVLKSSV